MPHSCPSFHLSLQFKEKGRGCSYNGHPLLTPVEEAKVGYGEGTRMGARVGLGVAEFLMVGLAVVLVVGRAVTGWPVGAFLLK